MHVSQKRFKRRLKWLTFALGIPGTAAAISLLWFGDYSDATRWLITTILLAALAILGSMLVHKVVFPLQTLANLLGGLREGDFSTRARGAMKDDALGEVLIEANALSETLREQRLGALEASALLRTVMSELDAAIFAFDESFRLKLANRAAENLLGRPLEQLLDRTAEQHGLEPCLRADAAPTLSLAFPGRVGRFGVRRSHFRQDGKTHHLLVLSDLSRALREEERLAWQRLVRVLSHELNNSLAPIKSLAGSLEQLLSKEPLPSDWREDARHGLGVIATRAEALTRFTEAYSRLAKLPPPRKTKVDLPALVNRVVAMESRVCIEVQVGDSTTILADADQLDQLLINLLRNAAEAMEATPGDEPIRLSWRDCGAELELCVEDAGPGLANPANLFVTFFTTKPKGSGIGLILCRQIAENHGGSLTLENRSNESGCVARLRLPNTPN